MRFLSFISLLACCSLFAVELQLPYDSYQRLMDTGECSALLARTFADKLAAVHTGYVPAGMLSNTLLISPNDQKKSMQDLEKQSQHFIMVPRSSQGTQSVGITLDDQAIITLPTSHRLKVPARLHALLQESGSNTVVNGYVTLPRLKILHNSTYAGA